MNENHRKVCRDENEDCNTNKTKKMRTAKVERILAININCLTTPRMIPPPVVQTINDTFEKVLFFTNSSKKSLSQLADMVRLLKFNSTWIVYTTRELELFDENRVTDIIDVRYRPLIRTMIFERSIRRLMFLGTKRDEWKADNIKYCKTWDDVNQEMVKTHIEKLAVFDQTVCAWCPNDDCGGQCFVQSEEHDCHDIAATVQKDVGPRIHVVSWNLRKLASLYASGNFERLIKEHEPDIIFGQEVS